MTGGDVNRIAHIDFIGGLLLIGTGLFFAFYGGANYPFGELRRMGPGFFPVVLGYTLAGLGVILLISSFTGVIDRLGGFAWRPFVAVLVGLSAFAWLVDKVGMVPSTLVMTVIVALGERQFRPVRTAILAVALAAIGVLIFSWGLSLPIPAFRWNI
jgi:hypothetical protein